MLELGYFLNTFVGNMQTFWLLFVILMVALALFSIWYNHQMDALGEKKQGYTALLVAVGNLVTLLAVAVLSWKAALLVLVAFIVSGIAMIAGDIRRSQRQREQQAKRPRRKALPYAAAYLVTEATLTLAEVERGLKDQLEGHGDDRKLGLLALAVKDASSKLREASKVEGE